MPHARIRFVAALAAVGGLCLVIGAVASPAIGAQGFLDQSGDRAHENDQLIRDNARRLINEGRDTFRFDTFGSETFFGDTLQLHKAVEGSAHGGVGGGVSPNTALSVGLKVDMDAVPQNVLRAVAAGQVDLDDPAVTLTLLKLNAVVGLTGFFNSDGTLRSLGAQCALCHSTVDDSSGIHGIGRRMDGWPNQDLNIGAILALSPNPQPVLDLLNTGVTDPSKQVDGPTLLKVLNGWGPGHFDAEVFLDRKATRPDGGNASTLIPPAFGMAGVSNHNWTGSWGNVTYWNAFVANLEMHGTPGSFYDPRLDNAQKYPIAAANHFGHVIAPPDEDRISAKLPGLHIYQLVIPPPRPAPGSFDADAALRGKAVFNGQGRCATCHIPPTFTEPGWNLHKASEIGIDDFQASRSPDDMYRTTPLAGRLFWRTRGYYHDGRFASLMDVVNHYNTALNLGLDGSQMSDLVEYLKSI
jgi:hypothetical protein